VYDGTSASVVHDFAPTGEGFMNAGGVPMQFLEYRGYLFMGAYFEGNGQQLFLHDRDQQTLPVIDVNPAAIPASTDLTFPLNFLDDCLLFGNMSGETSSFWSLTINGF